MAKADTEAMTKYRSKAIFGFVASWVQLLLKGDVAFFHDLDDGARM